MLITERSQLTFFFIFLIVMATVVQLKYWKVTGWPSFLHWIVVSNLSSHLCVLCSRAKFTFEIYYKQRWHRENMYEIAKQFNPNPHWNYTITIIRPKPSHSVKRRLHSSETYNVGRLRLQWLFNRIKGGYSQVDCIFFIRTFDWVKWFWWLFF